MNARTELARVGAAPVGVGGCFILGRSLGIPRRVLPASTAGARSGCLFLTGYSIRHVTGTLLGSVCARPAWRDPDHAPADAPELLCVLVRVAHEPPRTWCGR